PPPPPDQRDDARTRVSALSADWDPRRNIRAVEKLSDGRIVATLDGVQLEAWSPAGQRQWVVPDDSGGRDIVIAADEQSAWVGLVRSPWTGEAEAVVRLALQDGAQLDHFAPTDAVSLVRCADGLPALAPAGDNGARSRLRIRHGRRIYFRESVLAEGKRRYGPSEDWLAVAEPEPATVAGRPREPEKAGGRRLSPYAWIPGETHFAGPGIETADGDLVHAGSVHHGAGLQPGGSFVVRRTPEGGDPVWVFRTDRIATDLDLDHGADCVYVTYGDGELVVLDLHDGSVRRRLHLAVAGLRVVATALTVTGPGRMLVGTNDGRLLDCAMTGERDSAE
ncbi:hypothetical protein LZ495_39565, partial [Yinghuangia sp. KLBMP8922]|nr:hypothetical protein [Yinghuangia soli]